MNPIKLNRIKLMAQRVLSEKQIDALVDIEQIESERFLLSMVARLYADDEYSETITYPENWVEAIKDRWLPEWLKVRFPVRYKMHEISARVIYPKLKVSAPDRDPVFKMDWTTVAVLIPSGDVEEDDE
jgi:hypothetical protein